MFLSEARRWAGTHALGHTADGAVYLWWSLWLPLSLGSAALGIGCFFVARRWLRQGRRSDAVRLLFIGLISWLGLWAAVSTLESGAYYGARPGDGRRWPQQAGEPFSRAQWEKLEGCEWFGRKLGPPADGEAGIPTYPYVIPHDEALLERYTFVGLPPVEVERLLGGRLLQLGSWSSGLSRDPKIPFKMCCPDPENYYSYWVLELTFSLHSGVVRRERLYEYSNYPEYNHNKANGVDG